MEVEAEPDSAVIARVIAGDAEAFGLLVQRYQNQHFRFAVRMLGDRDDAEDALQKAFVRAYSNLASCRDPGRFGAWLHRIVVNECRTYVTRRERRLRRFTGDVTEVADAVEGSDDADLREELQKAVGRLPADQREAFLLKYVEELSYEEMAELTGSGVSALKMRVKRACAALRASMEGVHHG
jgi:RNA polymerase sigma-70 factor, ECF subfamily